MTDKSDQVLTGPAAPSPVPLPMAAASAPKAKRKRWPWVVGALVLIMLVGGCVGAVWLLGDIGNSIDETFNSDVMFTPETAAWSGNGRFGVVQHYRDDVYPSVAVWDRTTGESQSVDGYRLLFVEPYAPVIWLEPVTNDQAEAAELDDSFGDVFDHKPERLMAWRLDDGSKPTDDVPGKWGAWPGPGDTIAYLEINPLKGAGPSALLFNNKESHGEGVKVKLPDAVSTFVPIGWSASGRYFAIEQLLEAVPLDPATDVQGSSRRLMVFDALTGEMTGDFVMRDDAMGAPVAAWDGTEDRLFWMLSKYPEGDGPVTTRLWTAEATDSSAHDAFEAMGWEKPPGLEGSYDASVLGWDPTGPLFTVEGRIWRVTADGLRDLGKTDFASGSWYPGAGLLGVEWAYGNGPVDEEWTELFLYDEHGGSRQSVWRGPTSIVPMD